MTSLDAAVEQTKADTFELLLCVGEQTPALMWTRLTSRMSSTRFIIVAINRTSLI